MADELGPTYGTQQLSMAEEEEEDEREEEQEEEGVMPRLDGRHPPLPPPHPHPLNGCRL